MSSFARLTLAATLALGCSEAPAPAPADAADVRDAAPDASRDVSPPDDVPQAPDAPLLAYVAPGASGRPAVWVQRLDGSMRRQLHFDGVADEVPEQDDRVPPVSDARVLSVHHLAWSPEGTRLAAVVSTAIDQSEVVVLDVARGGGSVASANGQYVMPALDWSPDGRRLAFLMSTAPHAGGLELIAADLPAHRWQFLTRGAMLRGASARLRFDTTGASVAYSRIDFEEPTNPWNARSSLRRVTLATGAVTPVSTDLVGVVDGLTRDLTTAYLTRVTRAGTDGTRESTLIARSLTGATPPETTLVDRASVSYAAQGPHDGPLLVVDADPSGAGGVHRLLQPGAADVRIDLPREAERAALWTPAAPRSP